MNVIALLICLSLDRFTPIADKLRCYGWVDKYSQMIDKQCNQRFNFSKWLAVASLLVPVILVTLLIQGLLMLPFYGLFDFIFNLFVLLYCLGTVKVHRYTALDNSKPVETLFVQSQQQLFSILFWFVIFGAVGALVYRITMQMKRYYQNQGNADSSSYFELLQQYFDWIPTRLLGFIFALVGDFSQTFSAWWNHAWSTVSNNESFLLNCGFSALAVPEEDSEEGMATYQLQAVSLIERALLATLVIFILIVLVAWIHV